MRSALRAGAVGYVLKDAGPDKVRAAARDTTASARPLRLISHARPRVLTVALQGSSAVGGFSTRHQTRAAGPRLPAR